ncbi:MAG: phosphoenolpyruvate synthase [Candidatus Pacebacteria bacterium]|nr:phosphoenolpyruvate synthase [Candidatus Paceibacterota bacterium]
MEKANVLRFSEIRKKDVSRVGGKSASLGEMYSLLVPKGINIPNGFSTTAHAYLSFLEYNGFDKKLKEIFSDFNPKNLTNLQETGKKARNLLLSGKFPPDLEKDILEAYKKLCQEYGKDADVAVRSSATAEDLPSASFAGQHETYLNVKGEKKLLEAVLKSYSSLFTDRAISYRHEKGFKQLEVYLASCVQKMVRSDLASSGIMFTIDTETGFKEVVHISSIFGIGELIVKGRITPDDFYVFKPTLKKGFRPIIIRNLGRKTKKYVYGPQAGLKETSVSEKDQARFSLSEDEVLTLAKWGCMIEDHYNYPQDIEWAKDGKTGKLFVVQSRPETVHSLSKARVYEEYDIKAQAKPLLTGIAIGEKIGSGKARVILDTRKMKEFKEGEVLVTKMTDPDWNSIMVKASAIITDEGGKTCHSAIISRELGIPCIVGTKEATKKLKTGMKATVDCTQLKGRVFSGLVPFKVKKYNLDEIPDLPTKIMLNLGTPESAFKSSFLPVAGVGLAREEFIIAEKIKIHPLALIHFNRIKSKLLKEEIKEIEDLTKGYRNKVDFFINELAEGISQIAAAFYPKPVIVRFSDFKTNEYRHLIGGKHFEGEENNPMLGFRGACRYIAPSFRPAFELECLAVKKAREEYGLTNISVMVPFCRTVEEGKKTREIMKELKLDNLKVYVMCEIPSNVILIDEFLKIFDGMSIGSNDLTQLVLGLDRDNSGLAHIGNENNEAVKELIRKVIKKCNEKGKYCGICGQAPSDYPEFARFLMEEGIESISLNPDTVIKTILSISNKSR